MWERRWFELSSDGQIAYYDCQAPDQRRLRGTISLLGARVTPQRDAPWGCSDLEHIFRLQVDVDAAADEQAVYVLAAGTASLSEEGQAAITEHTKLPSMVLALREEVSRRLAPEALEEAAAGHTEKLLELIEREQQQFVDNGSTRLRIQPSVSCVCSIHGGDASLLAARSRLEKLVLAKPQLLLPSVGMKIPRSW